MSTWFIHIPWPYVLFAYGIAFACFLFWIVGFVFVSGNRATTSLGSLSTSTAAAFLRVPEPQLLRELERLSTEQRITSKADITPNIELCWDEDDDYFRVVMDRNKIFRKAQGRAGFMAVVLHFRNRPRLAQGSRKAINVRAEVSYYDENDSEVVSLRTDGCWLDEASSRVSFDVYAQRYLILGIFYSTPDAFNFQVYDSADASDPWAMSSSGTFFRIAVKLSWGEDYIDGIEEDFELVIDYGKQFKSYQLFRLLDRDEQTRKIPRGQITLR